MPSVIPFRHRAWESNWKFFLTLLQCFIAEVKHFREVLNMHDIMLFFFFFSNFTVRITLRTVFIQHAVYSRSVAVLRNPWGSIKVYASYFKLNLCIKGCFPLIFCRGKEMGWEIYQVPCASLVVIFNLYFLKLKRLVKTVCDKL